MAFNAVYGVVRQEEIYLSRGVKEMTIEDMLASEAYKLESKARKLREVIAILTKRATAKKKTLVASSKKISKLPQEHAPQKKEKVYRPV